MSAIEVKLLEFGDLIQRYVEGFVGRQWLVEKVDGLLADPACRFVVLTGGPGVGKSAFLAYLAATHSNWPRYFIRRDNRNLLRPGDGKTFFLTIGGQLATLRSDLFMSEQLNIAVEQRIGDVGSSGEVMGVRIAELKASPFYTVAIQVKQEMQRVAGKATGVAIDRLVTEPRLLTLQDLQCLGLLDPAWVLYRKDPTARITVLVDALDELRFGSLKKEDEGIVQALSNLPEIPPNLRFIITSRREKFLDKLLGRSDVHELPLDVASDENLLDLRSYTIANLPENGLGAALSHVNKTKDHFVSDLLARSAGNFLYLRSVLNAITEALADKAKSERLQRLLRVEGLPDDLDALYAYFLDSIVTWIQGTFGEPAWRTHLRPLLGILATAQEPLSNAQLRKFTGLASEDLADLLRELRQFVEAVNGRQIFRIYHTSFAEYLLDAESNVDYRIDGTKWHKRIADHYWEGGEPKWPDLDEYGLKYLAIHLAGATALEALYTLISKRWMDAKLAATASHRAFANDVRIAIEAAGNERPPNLPQLIRNSLIDTTLGALTNNVLPEALGLLARLGRASIARDTAALIHEPKRRSDAYRSIAQALLAANNLPEARAMLDIGVRAARTISDPVLQAQALGAASVIVAQIGDVHEATLLADQALTIALAISNGKEQTLALSATACSLARLGDASRAQQIAERAATSARAWKLFFFLGGQMILAPSRDEGDAEIQKGGSSGKWRSALPKAEVLLNAAETMIYLGDKQLAHELIEEAQSETQCIPTAEERAFVIAQAAVLLAELGERTKVIDTVNRAFDTIRTAPDCNPDQLSLIKMSIGGFITQLNACYSGDNICQARMFAKVAEAMAHIGVKQALVNYIVTTLRGVQTIPNPLVRAEALGWIAVALDQAGETTGAQQIVAQAIATAQELPGNGWKLRLPLAAAEACVGVQSLKRAAVFAEDGLITALGLNGHHKQTRDWAIDRVVAAFASAQDAQALLAFRHYLQERMEAIEGALWAVRLLIAEGNTLEIPLAVDNATTLIEQIPNSVGRVGRFLELVGILLLQAQQERSAMAVLERALATAQMIEAALEKAKVLSAIARAFATLGHGEQASREAGNAYALAQTLQESNAKVEALMHVAVALAQASHYDQAEIAARSIAEIERDMYTQMFGAVSKNTVQTLVNIGVIMSGALAFDRALSLTQAELGYAENSDAKEELLTAVVRGLAREKEWVRAEEIAATIGNVDRRSRTLTELTVSLANAGERDRARSIAQAIELPDAKMSALYQTASLLAQSTEWEQALSVAETISGQMWKAQALTDIAFGLARSGNRSRTVSIVREAHELARSIAATCDKATLLSRLAQVYMEVGEDGTARTILGEAFQISRDGGRDCIFQILESSLRSLAKLDQGETLWHVYDSVREVEKWWVIA